MAMDTQKTISRPQYGSPCVDEQHCFDCDIEIPMRECSEPLCSASSGSVTAASTAMVRPASATSSSASNGSGGEENVVNLTPLCTADCIVVTCDDPDHAEPTCNEQSPHNVHCDLGCDVSVDCQACHGFDAFLQCCENYNSTPQSEPLSQNSSSTETQRLPQQQISPQSSHTFSWDSSFNDFQAWCDCTPQTHSGGSKLAAVGSSFSQQQQHQHHTNAETLHRTSTTTSHPSGSPISNTGVNLGVFGYPSVQHSSVGNSTAFHLNLGAYAPSHLGTNTSIDSATGTSSLPSTSALTPLPYSCMWGDCHASFASLSDLVGHVNVQHLVTSSALFTLSSLGDLDNVGSTVNISSLRGSRTHNGGSYGASSANGLDSVNAPPHQSTAVLNPQNTGIDPVRDGNQNRPCLWANCTTVEAASFDGLAYHLYQDHLGIPVPSTSNSGLNGAPYGQSNRGPTHHYTPSMSPSQSAATMDQSPSPLLHHGMISHPQSQISMVAQATTSNLNNVIYSPSTAASSSPRTPPSVSEEIANEKQHNCSEVSHECKWAGCTRTFLSCDTLTAHINADHVGSGKAKYECFWDACHRNGSQGFMSKQKICRHVQSHTGHRPFQCTICQQYFSEAATLQQHIRRHTQEKPYVCDHPGCGKSFAITGALTIHKRTHNGDKPFKCTYCDRGFAESSNLSKHLRTHTGARPYACPEPGCGKTFARPDQLNRHKSVHQRQIRGSTTQD